MKLLYCLDCEDVFKLSFEVKTCKCKKVQGRYINRSEAEVSENGISIAIGNGSLDAAIADMQEHFANTKGKATRSEYQEIGKGGISHAWVRPNTGAGNPHSRLI